MSALTLTGARPVRPDGRVAPASDLHVADARIADARADGARVIDARGLWAMPGIRDVHTHIAWSDFHAADRDRRSTAEQDALTRSALRRTLAAGVTSIRDAGGAPVALAASGAVGPRLQVAVDMIGATAGGPDAVRARVAAAAEHGAQWIKLIATAGVAAADDAALESHFSAAEFAAAADEAHRHGLRLMVHTWGGVSVDRAIEVGAASIEHALFLTVDQAARAADAGVVYVPTLTIYRQVRELVAAGAIDGVPLPRLDAAIAQHVTAVRRARDAGGPIAVGSDFGTADQHGANRLEIAALMRAGLAPAEALTAATTVGARLLGEGEAALVPGERADIVLLNRDPARPETHEDPTAVVLVVQDGRIAYSTIPGVAPD